MKAFGILIFLVGLSIVVTTAFQCYSCSSLITPHGCADPFASSIITSKISCSGYCKKFEEGDIVNRSCAASCTESRTELSNIVTDVKCCNTELCNGAKMDKASTLMAVIMTAMVGLYVKMFSF